MVSMPQWAKSSMLRVALPAAGRSHRGWVSLADGCDLGIKLGDGAPCLLQYAAIAAKYPAASESKRSFCLSLAVVRTVMDAGV